MIRCHLPKSVGLPVLPHLSNLNIFTIKLRLLDLVAVPSQYFLDPEQILLERTEVLLVLGPAAELGLALLDHGILVPVLVDQVSLVLGHLLLLHFEDGAVDVGWVELDPLGSQHEVDVLVVLEAPVFEDSTQLKLADDFVRRDQRVHVGLQTQLGVH